MTRPFATAAVLFASVTAITPLWALSVPQAVKLPPETVQLRSSGEPGYALAHQKCGLCHSADYVSYQPPGMTQSQWTAEVSKMQHSYGAPISDTEVIEIGKYLSVAYGGAKPDAGAVTMAQVPPVSASSARDAPSLLARNGCLGCHSLAQKVVGPAYKDVATKYRADPLAQDKLEASIRAGGSGKWGTTAMPPFPALTPLEVKTLAEFIRRQ